jgi:acyl-CoA synthetase (AMP-forming)/AMP-acid ligase II
MTRGSNIADRLRDAAGRWPDRIAVVAPAGRAACKARYRTWTFRQLDDESERLALGLLAMGVQPGMRLVLFVRFSWEFIALTFALFKSRATVVLIDPGMGRANIFECLRAVQPDGFVAIPLVQAMRVLKRQMFPRARFNVTVGRRWGWGGWSYRRVLREGERRQEKGLGIGDWALGIGDLAPHESASSIANAQSPMPNAQSSPAAVIFTSGSTGPPKGVVYEHSMFDSQVEQIRDFYGIEPGEVDLPGFPLFGLFNAAMGVTTVIPDMDPTKPAQVDPTKIITAINDWQVTQAFGSPAFWNRVGRHCEQHGVTLPTIRRGLSAGGPVPVHVLRRMAQTFTGPGADLHTPYGATESLPVASIGAREVLERTAALTAVGKGTCVGKPFPAADVRIIAITDGPIATIADARELPAGEIGEIVVRSPSVTREYFQRPEATAGAKIAAAAQGDAPVHQPSTLNPKPFYHRLGDVGYLDADGRLWFCGRKAHIVHTEWGPMYSVCCEAILDEHPQVYRSALVGVPSQKPGFSKKPGFLGADVPVIVVEPEPGSFPESPQAEARLRTELLLLARANPLTERIERFLFHRSLPVDTRHNVKINREALREWAQAQDNVA